jgi:hypothetical protein
LNKSGNAAGLIPSNFLITILKRGAFYTVPNTEEDELMASANQDGGSGNGSGPRLSAVEEVEERNESSMVTTVNQSRD